MLSETQLKRQIVRALRKAGWIVRVCSETRRTRMPKGWPDLHIRHLGAA